MLFGIGIGAVIAPAMNAGTSGVEPRDAGIASATVNIAQQLGGSIGIAFLNSLAASALTRYTAGKDATNPTVHADGVIHSYAVAFWCSSAILAAGAIACGLIMLSGKPKGSGPEKTTRPSLSRLERRRLNTTIHKS